MEVQFMEHIRHSLLIDKNKDLIIEKLLNLTLEIICLLTREDFTVVRKSGDRVTEDSGPPAPDTWTRTQSPITEAPPHAPIEERNRDGMVLEPAEIFNGETEKVPGKSKDVEVSFSMTEWDYSGPEDVVMDTRQPHGSVGDSSSGSPPERCETPLYPPDCIKEENRIVSQDFQAEPEQAVFHQPCKEEKTVPGPIRSGRRNSRNRPVRCETPLYSPHCIEEENRIITQDYQAEPGNGIFRCKEEAVPTEISTGGCSSRDPPEICETPLYSPDCIEEENRIITQDYQAKPRGRVFHPRCKEEAVPAEISLGEGSSRNLPERCETPLYSLDCIEEENGNIAQNYQAEPVDGMFFQQFKEEAIPAEIGSGVTLDPGDHRGLPEFLPEHCIDPTVSYNTETFYTWEWNQRSDLTTHQNPYPGCFCGKCLSCKRGQTKQQRKQTVKKQFSCSDCERSFAVKSALTRHHRNHGEKPYICSECGKCFSQMSNLTNHKRSHNKKHVCPQCGKRFRDHLVLMQHQQTHMNSKPYVCSECGKSFKCKAYLTTHMRVHTGEKPYSCPECNKCFSQKISLVQHQRTHSGEKPFSCSECGKCFAAKSNLYKHKRIHRRQKSFLCSECGQSFTSKTHFLIHMKIHT
ncbi:uncharacterized protein LOC142140705 isoform X1 [Mixophyes fleayi]|uniref:uncharacterized protein LOC142140705 isoform X1 n=1 Tax=Mixophyes fleayi TaxID=3061075 RepID=UPI003F4E0B41